MADPVRRRKKPVVVDTIQWTGDNEDEVQAFTIGATNFYALDPEDRENSEDPEATATVFDNLHNTWVLVYTGQHIVRGVKREYYPIAEEVLADTYEPAEAEARRPRTRWHVELREHDGWVPATTPLHDRDRVAEALAQRRDRNADREFRMVRATTNYTVEES